MMWSKSCMPIASQPFFNWLVRLLSCVLATVEPDGWLCERMIPEAWETRAVWRTMRMSTTVQSIPPVSYTHLKKFRTVKVHLKAGYEVMLYAKE